MNGGMTAEITIELNAFLKKTFTVFFLKRTVDVSRDGFGF
jgi:hypothetical protein